MKANPVIVFFAVFSLASMLSLHSCTSPEKKVSSLIESYVVKTEGCVNYLPLETRIDSAFNSGLENPFVYEKAVKAIGTMHSMDSISNFIHNKQSRANAEYIPTAEGKRRYNAVMNEICEQLEGLKELQGLFNNTLREFKAEMISADRAFSGWKVFHEFSFSADGRNDDSTQAVFFHRQEL